MKEIERNKSFMNTVISIKVVQNEEPTYDINLAIEEAFGEFDRIVKSYTRFNENSELSNLNRNNGNFVKVTEEFFMLIEKMLDLAQKTDGCFDPTVIDFLEVYGYDKNYDFSKLDKPELNDIVKKTANSRKSYKEIKLNNETKEVCLAKGQRIDLGGIGKGYAIDCAYEKLSLKLKNFLIDAGGDIRASGNNSENQPWKIALKASIGGEPMNIGQMSLKDSALASSGSWARRVRQFHHIINPVSGQPVIAKYSTVFVEAPTALEADGWATALFVGGSSLQEKLPDHLKCLFF